MLKVSEDLRKTYPNSRLGILIMKDVRSLITDPEFSKVKLLLNEYLLNEYKNYDRKEFVNSKPMCYYKNYYKKFNKTYPVLLQLESIIVKLRSFPNSSTLVESMFMAELKNLLLTAAHDFDKIQFPLHLNLTQGTESFLGISGNKQFTAKNDMMISDKKGIISTILNGPDYRTQVTENTKNAVFYVYSPGGIDNYTIINHLNDIARYVSIFSPNAKIDLLNIF